MNLLWDGVDFDLPGNGGPKCSSYTSGTSRIFESFLGIVVSSIALRRGYRKLTPLSYCRPLRSDCHRPFIFLFSSILGLEVAYKILTRQMIFLLNPCHVLSFLQLVLLLSWSYFKTDTKEKNIVVRGEFIFNALFRINLHLAYLPVFAVLFPVLNTRFLPFEVASFWLEHAAMILITFYFLRNTIGDLSSDVFTWSLISYGVFGLFNFGVLHLIDWLTECNVNYLLCPALSDPFAGTYYRLHSFWHQFIPNVIIARVYSLISDKWSPNKKMP